MPEKKQASATGTPPRAQTESQAKMAKYRQQICQLVPINSLWKKFQQEVLKNVNMLAIAPGKYLFKEGSRDFSSFYLLSGELAMESKAQGRRQIVTPESDAAKYALAQLQPRRFSARAESDVVVAIINRALLERLIVLQEKEQSDSTDARAGGDVSVQTLKDQDGEGQAEEGDWMAKMLQSELFSKVPTANIYKLFNLMETLQVNAKQVIVRQGEKGDAYYVIQKGKCAVLQKITPAKPPVKVAHLGVGDAFGEESLVSEGARNASIVMMTPGILKRLSKKDFVEMISKPALATVSYAEAEKMGGSDEAVWLDVRFPSEAEANPLKGSLNIPFYLLRRSLSKLDRKKRYVVCCDTGERSCTAALLLTQEGLNSCYLDGGLQASKQ